MKIILTVIASFILFSSQAQTIHQVQKSLISKYTPINIWKVIDIDTSYYIVFMNAKYSALQDQSVTKLTKLQLQSFAVLIQKMASNDPGEYQVKTEYGLTIFMDKGEKSYWITVYDTQDRYIKVKSNLAKIILKDISSQ